MSNNITTVDFHTFIDLVSIFNPKLLTHNYNEYRKILIHEYQTNEDILHIVDLVRSIEVDDEGFLKFDSYNLISVVIYNNGIIKYVACY